MIPEEEEMRGSTHELLQEEEEEAQDEVMLAGYKECAKEALTWLLNLGYEPGHPLIRSLVAHLTKKQAYLEKLNLENFLIEEAVKGSREEEVEGEAGNDSEREGNTGDDLSMRNFEYFSDQIKNDKEIQKALVNAVFRGCDLQYKTD